MTTHPYTGTWSPDQFRGKTLVGVDFSNRCLVGVDFTEAVLKDCDFSNSDLSHANFTGADLYRCNFSRSVLYAAELDNANLTRANFTHSFIYGWLLNSTANVTYAQLLNFSIEERRRTVIVSETHPDYIRAIAFGQQIGPTADLCQQDYQVGNYRHTFTELEPQEAALQKSQVYNRLKRLYRENQNGEAALHCLYQERYWLTRSYYRLSPLTLGRFRESMVKTAVRTAGAYLAEVISGYGVRPGRIVRNLVVLWLIFTIATTIIGATSSSNGVLYTTPTRPAVTAAARVAAPQTAPSVVDIGKPNVQYGRTLHYTLLSTVTPDPQRYTAYGIMDLISLVYFFLAAMLLALLFSSVFIRLLSE
ncbi:pentapeptide repeat-containing protein [Micromonospora sp. D93]|uniref:pentapeptide repeat-containing protein n=1 Tax=Micromonospora sp. D93 TaxID=2824886 RepID=UPI001B384682|nr:pentapeptide repeat-containing protein [Micromonospora sp. D93]MBQ1019189.1 pentapeptide repeat-containing protein [Micromonospora sp. D93]